LVEAVDRFTKHTHENRYNVEGWKTNEGHLLAQKFIVPYMVEKGWSNKNSIRLRSSSYADNIKDLIKVLCSLTGKNYDDFIDLYHFLDDKSEFGKWMDWGFFHIKGFKKGTLHLKFKDEKIWQRLNQQYAKIKGQVLPEKI
jgi:hypothetical protein